ncbi:MAG: phosphoglycerate kinase [Candidatus Doudnabacteria bacterium RIFCSPHIGHO2_01_FULL_43_23]|uniref:Phosphoglycerate kinase n=1 Tax=Candidatus Doudnabacteria bacterium RIFCSPHIGHO2_01_FULL_43_23 TaxID=1817822 RepID=A0A1F5NW06_9BACT|nr:MAG: phosphoglycerate kinase [Candidatus Doudnabacteria bacterium RIFCSPHIGHO2_01_FULL_43_23]
MPMKSLKTADVKNKTVIARVDLDTPLGKDSSGNIIVRDDYRLQRILPTIQWLASHKAKTVVIGHLRRPKGWDKDKSLLPVAQTMADLLKLKFIVIDEKVERLPHYDIPHVFFFAEDFRAEKSKRLLKDLNPGDIAVLENIRFYPEEEKDSEKFARELASLGEIYVNDSFATVYHANQVSIMRLATLLPHYAGFELEKETKILSQVLATPERPYLMMIGGVKLSEKLAAMSGILNHCDSVIVGGGIATLFYLAQGYEVGKSLAEKSKIVEAKDILRNYKSKIHLPVDVVVARSPEEEKSIRVTKPDEVSPEEMILDIGPETIKKYSEIIREAKTVLWSGPMGLFENKHFAHGTKALGRLFASRSQGLSFGIAGGGDTLAAIKMLGVGEDIDHLSTGGSSMLQYLSGIKLPGIEVLKD